MYRKPARFVSLLVVLFLLVITTACSPVSPLTQKTPVTVMGILANTSSTDVVEAHIVVSRGKHTVETTASVVQNEFQATLQVPVGDWDVTVLLVDSQGIVRFQSKAQSTQISLAQPQVVELVLRPADSKVHVDIDMENYIFKNVAMRARIHFNDDIHEVIRDDLLTPLEASVDLTPGSYEFKVELYTESFRVGDRLGPGVWEVIHITENEELFITWSPVSEALQISGRVETLLPSPTNLTLTEDADGVRINWDPVDHFEVVGYFLFTQVSPLDRFECLSSVPLENSSYLHKLDLDDPAEISYIVAAVSNSGMVGYYSPPVKWTP